MANIISIDKKRKLTQKKQASLVKQRKIRAVQKIFHCTHCASKCEKCGTQIAVRQSHEEHDLRVPYHFCETCSEEYIAYIKRLKGEETPEYYWHNEEWLKLWRSWIDYQSAVDRYLKSKAFLKLLQEIKESHPEA